MALIIDSTAATISVVVSKDSAVNCTEEEYDEYLKDLDESHLCLDGEPTRFVLRKNLPYEASQRVMDAQASYVKGQVKMQMSYVLEEVRASLIDIVNPSDLPKEKQLVYKRHSDGLCSKEIIGLLQSYGVLMDLYRARSNFASGPKGDVVKKK